MQSRQWLLAVLPAIIAIIHLLAEQVLEPTMEPDQDLAELEAVLTERAPITIPTELVQEVVLTVPAPAELATTEPEQVQAELAELVEVADDKSGHYI